MGVWGEGIFCNDSSLDIRDDFIDLITYDRSTEEAIKYIVEHYGLHEVNEETSDGWLALAHTAWKYGRMNEELKQTALRVIDSGIGEKAWKNEKPSSIKKRHQLLLAEKEHLLSPQPPIKKLKKEKVYDLPWRSGEIYAFPYKNHEWRAILVIETEEYCHPFDDKCNAVIHPRIVTLLDWSGNEKELDQIDPKQVRVLAHDKEIISPIRVYRYETFCLDFCGPMNKKEFDQSKQFVHCKTVSNTLIGQMLEHYRKNKNRTFNSFDFRCYLIETQHCLEWSEKTLLFLEK